MISMMDRHPVFDRVIPRCPLFGKCGGCTLQDLDYPDQLLLKERSLARALASAGIQCDVAVVGLEEPWRYRNKAEFTFGESGGAISLGFHAKRSFSRIVDLEDCFLLPAPLLGVLRTLKQLVQETGLPVYCLRTHQGFFRYAMIRQSTATGEIQLCLLTTSAHPAGYQETDESAKVVAALFRQLAKRHPRLRSGYWGVTDKRADAAIPDTLTHLYGETLLKEKIGPFEIQLHPLTFLQSSTVQAERLYQAVMRAMGAEACVAWDLYCGVGLISFYLSRKASRVYGIEQSPNAVALARNCAKANGIANVAFHQGPVETILQDRRFWFGQARPDVVVVDPPRAGLNPAVISSIVCARPSQVGYISCNARSLARDLQGLLSGFPRYRVKAVEAFDMFPQTDHVETLVWLKRVS